MDRHTPISRRFLLLVPVALLCAAAAAGGCQRRSGGVVRKSPDGRVQATFPSGWESAALGAEDAKISMRKPGQEMYALVLSESKTDFNGTLEDYTKAVNDRWLTGGKVVNPHLSAGVPVTVNGCRAYRFEATGGTGMVNVTRLRVYVETPTRYNQLILWTTSSRFDAAKPEFDAIVASFRENP